MSDEKVFTGDLSFLPLPDVFQLLGGVNCTGILRLTSKYAENPCQIYFVNGNPINAAFGHLHGLEAIYAVFGWTEGKVEFKRENVEVNRVIDNGRMEIVLEAMRLIDEGVIKIVGPSSDEASTLAARGGKDELIVIRRPIEKSISVLEYENYNDGKTIVREGGHGDWMWVILKGVVRITKKTPENPVTIARLGEGCFIGNLAAFSIHGKGRNATGIAEGHVKLGLLDFQSLSDEYLSLSNEMKGLFNSLDGRLRKIADRVVDIHMKKDNTYKKIKNKKILLKKGSSTKKALVVTEGEVYVVRQLQKGYFLLITLEKGDVFGYMPFLDIGQEPQNASIVASGNLKVDKLDLNSLQEEFNKLSGTMKGLVEGVAVGISLTTIRVSQLKMKYSATGK